MSNEERTPVRTLYGVARVEEQLTRIEEHAQHAAKGVDALAQRVRAVELTHIWLPYALFVFNAAGTVYLWTLVQALAQALAHR